MQEIPWGRFEASEYLGGKEIPLDGAVFVDHIQRRAFVEVWEEEAGARIRRFS